ncbi:MAG: LLM class flavin-dependent oxidoreductase [Lachnospiraceae bacterium]|nr:LLM class flavin-dependent oxidoreductase [Lachnospiraceae bacterium]
MPLKDDLKALIIKSGNSITSVSSELNKRHGTDMSVQNLSSKMKRGTLKYSEVEEILDIIGYKIEWVPK